MENKEIEELKQKIAEKKEELKELENWEGDEDDYDQWLDDIYPEVDICGSKTNASWALKNTDEVRYNMGKGEWEDEQINEKKEEKENEISELEDELKDSEDN